MKLTVIVGGILSVLAFVAHARQARVGEFHPSSLPLANTEAEQRIVSVLDEMVKLHQTYLSVPIQDGKALRLLAEAADAKNLVEVGTSTGFSGLWFCLALQRTGGHLTTFEIDHPRAAMAREHFKKAGVEKMVTVVEATMRWRS
jgi:caffeoyl-CoA O-methyltransferase